ncbi:MAG: hypothetical protein GX653_04930, partial [Clostridiales bacterium]|nr:hypothetical protein [Clostridiales bacterium]
MMKLTKRLSALLLALAMMLTGLSALAEAPATPLEQPAVMAVYERGNSLKTVMDVRLDAQTAMGLLGMMGALPADDASMQPLVTTVIEAINKLKTTMVSDNSNAAISIGTDGG